MRTGVGARWARLGLALGLVLCVSLVPVSPSAAADLPPLVDGKLPLQTYGARDGLTSVSVMDMAQDAEGFLWIGTEDGLFRADGRRFQRYGVDDGLPSTYVLCMVASGRRLWVGTTKGLAYVEAGRVGVIGAERGGPSGRVEAVIVDGAGHVWATGPDFTMRETDASAFESVPGIERGGESMWSDADGVFLAQGTMLHSFSRGRLVRSERLPLGEGEVAATLARDARGCLWVRSLSRLLRRCGSDVAFVERTELLPASSSVTGEAVVDHRGRLWVATELGVAVIDGDDARLLGAAQGLEAESVRTIFEDREGSVWLGGSGLHRVRGGGAWLDDGAGVIPSKQVWCLTRTADGRLVAGTSAGLWLRDAAGWRVVPGTEDATVFAATLAPDGAIWFGGIGARLGRLAPDGSVRSFAADVGLKGVGVRKVLFDRSGSMWVQAHRGGLLQSPAGLVPPTLTDVPGTSIDDQIYDVVFDATGAAWVSTAKGLTRLGGAAPKTFTVADGLRSNDAFLIIARKRGELCVSYISALGATCFRPDGDALRELHHLGVAEGLGTDMVFTFGEDAGGALWVGTSQGVTWFGPHGVERFHSGNGLPGDDMLEQSFLADTSGDVWLGTNEGLGHFRVAEHRPLPAPNVVVRGALVGRTFEATLGLPTYADTEALVVETRLVGLDSAFAPIEGTRLRFAGLAPGHYRLEARARLGLAPPGPVATLAVVVKPKVWETTWGRLLGAFALVAASALVVRWRFRLLVRRHRELKRHALQLEARRLEIEQLNNDLRRQIAERSRRWVDELARLAAGGEVVNLRNGDLISGRYRVAGTLGQGGMGVVHRVVREADGQAFALKALPRPKELTGLARFAREAEILARLEHPSVVGIVDFDVAESGFVYLVMDLVDGRPLSECRDRWGDVGFGCAVLAQVAKALAYVHEQGVLHRDLKPGNVLVAGGAGERPLVKVTDFGVSWLRGARGAGSETGDTISVDRLAARPQPPRRAPGPPSSRAAPEVLVATDPRPTRPTHPLSPSDEPRGPSDEQAKAALPPAGEDVTGATRPSAGPPSSPSLGASGGGPPVSGVAPGAVVAAESWSNASESGLTNDGHLVGTPRYIAPELAAGHVMLSPASDVFSFGILAYEVLSGARPFAEPPVKRRARGLPLSPPVPLAAQNPDVPEALGRLIDRCLLEAVGERPTAAELARALAAEPALAAPAGEEPARHLAH